MNHFRAPWSKSLIVASIFATLVCLGASYTLWKLPMEVSESIRFWLALLPLAIILLCAFFVVRGYSITNDALLIDRLFWETRVPLSGLQSVKSIPTRRAEAFAPSATAVSLPSPAIFAITSWAPIAHS